MDRLTLIVDRARTLDIAPRPRTCSYCRLAYRHTGGVTTARGWFCSGACAKPGAVKSRAVREAELFAALIRQTPSR